MTSLFAARSATRGTRRRGIAFAALLGTSVLLMILSSLPATSPAMARVKSAAGFAFSPLEGALSGFARGATSLIAAIGDIDHLRSENASLTQQLDLLKTQNAQAVELRQENEQLSALLQTRDSLRYSTVAATVIVRNASEFQRLITIDEGSDKGIKVGDVVVAAGSALAGRVTSVGPNFAQVLLINDTNSDVIGQEVQSAATGEVIGQAGGVLVMQNVDASERLLIGQQVVTAGIQLGDGVRSAFPKGLVIGQIVDVQRDANAVVQTAFIQPAVNLDKLEYVLVIVNYQGGLPDVLASPTAGTLPGNEQPFASPSPASPRPTPSPTAKH